MAKSTNLEHVSSEHLNCCRCEGSLGGGLSLSKLDCASNGSTVQPAIRIDPERGASELFEAAWLLDGLQQGQKT